MIPARVHFIDSHSILCLTREVARMLADDFKKRVMIVDTSNEIGGDGDVPHVGIGSARRMQVPNPDMQHKVSFHISLSAAWKVDSINFTSS